MCYMICKAPFRLMGLCSNFSHIVGIGLPDLAASLGFQCARLLQGYTRSSQQVVNCEQLFVGTNERVEGIVSSHQVYWYILGYPCSR